MWCLFHLSYWCKLIDMYGDENAPNMYRHHTCMSINKNVFFFFFSLNCGRCMARCKHPLVSEFQIPFQAELYLNWANIGWLRACAMKTKRSINEDGKKTGKKMQIISDDRTHGLFTCGHKHVNAFQEFELEMSLWLLERHLVTFSH